MEYTFDCTELAEDRRCLRINADDVIEEASPSIAIAYNSSFCFSGTFDRISRQDDHISLGREVGGAVAEEGGSVWRAAFIAHSACTEQPFGTTVVVRSGRIKRIYPHLVRRMDNTSAAYVHRHVGDLL